MKKILINLIIAVALLSFAGCSATEDTKEKANPVVIQELQTELAEIDSKLLENKDDATLIQKKKEVLIMLGEEYLKNEDFNEHSEIDTTFVDAIAVYEELPKLIDIKIEGKSDIIEQLGRYIRRNIQILFLQKEYDKSYELAKRMYEIEPLNMGNQNLYVDSAVGLAEEAFQREDFEESRQYAQEASSIRYDQKALQIYGDSLLALAEQALEQGDYKKAKDYMRQTPPIPDNAKYNAKADEINKTIIQHLTN